MHKFVNIWNKVRFPAWHVRPILGYQEKDMVERLFSSLGANRQDLLFSNFYNTTKTSRA